MNIYLAGASHQATTKWIQQQGYDKLLSYMNDKSLIEKWITNVKQKGDTGSKLFIDSGAFTAWTKGKEVDVDAYIQWLNERVDYIYLFGQVDSIPGNIDKAPTQSQVEEAAQKTWENYLYMRERVINKDGLLYTYHVGEPQKFLEQVLNWTDENGEHIKYIALGGMVSKAKPVKEAFLSRCFEAIKKSTNPNVKTHAFGMTSLDLLEKYPITSADSTGWLMTAMTGSIFTELGTVCVSEQTEKNPDNFTNLLPRKQKVVKDHLLELGYTYEQVRTDRYAREEVNAAYLSEWAKNYVYKETISHQTKLFKMF